MTGKRRGQKGITQHTLWVVSCSRCGTPYGDPPDVEQYVFGSLHEAKDFLDGDLWERKGRRVVCEECVKKGVSL